MKKRNLIPVQTAPVERVNATSSSEKENGLSASLVLLGIPLLIFAGEDAE